MGAAFHDHDHDQDRTTHRVALRLSVPRDAAGGLPDGVAARIARPDGVEVAEVDVLDLRPRLNDLAVEAEATVRLPPAVDPADLTDLVGVHEVRPR